MDRDVHSLMLSIQHFLCQPQHHPPSKVAWRMVSERLSWWHALSMQVSVLWQLPEKVPVDSQRSWSFSIPSHWSCAWSTLETNWTGWVRASIPDGHVLLSWRTPWADCSRGLCSWSSHIVPEWLDLVLRHVDFSEDLPQACMPDAVKWCPEVYEVVE